MKTVIDYNRAGYPILYIATTEAARLRDELRDELRGHLAACWDLAAGWRRLAGAPHPDPAEECDPAQAITRAAALRESVVFFENFHVHLDNPFVFQTLLNAIPLLKSNGTTIVITAPSVKLPPEIAPLVRVLDHDLPAAPALSACLDSVLTGAGATVAPEIHAAAVAAGAGMTLAAFEDAVALSLVRDHTITPATIWREKADALKKSGGAEIAKDTGARFSSIGGLEGLKAFTMRSLTSGRAGARGVLLLGCPGTGKSMFAKALGAEVGRCTISLDLGRMFQSLVGESERMMRDTLKTVDRMAPSVLFIDEIEKGLAGLASGGRSDGGTGSRLFGTLLTWLNDHESDTYIVATCNDVSQIPPEFLRQERWDGIFFVDLPTYEERQAIWTLYRTTYRIPDTDAQPSGADSGWTGAEIKSACRLAHIQGIPLADACRSVIPLTVSAAGRILATREAASGRSLSASTGGVYVLGSNLPAPAPAGRRISARKEN